jgi:diguanylate cyclase (GGDEF)-like protein
LNTKPSADCTDDSDLFVVDIGHEQAYECCAGLRLLKTNPNKLIVFTYDNYSRKRIKYAIESDIGVTDFWDLTTDPLFIKFRLDSLIRYKKMYEVFLEKMRKSLYLSAIDSTTEVYNRSFFDDYLKNKKCSASGFAVAMLDVDKFKTINDKYGHSFADSMLKHISCMIKRYIRSSDIVARYGGDEFIILMDAVSKTEASDIVNRIQKRIENSLFGGTSCTVSIGVCCAEPNGSISSFDDAISIADSFMYAAKQDGGNTVKVCM